jgi:epoxyqueuosine reductase
MKDKLLLHTCCGPCSGKIIEQLLLKFDVIGYFYNPNIEPTEEYLKRVDAAVMIYNNFGIRLIKGIYNNKTWHSAITGLEFLPEGDRRCWRCFRTRLVETAQRAKKEGIGNFATTLTTSPFKNEKVINKLGNVIGLKYGINFIETSVKLEDKNKPSLARKLGIYHQKFCGCNYSQFK